MSAYVSSKRLREAHHDSIARENRQMDVHGLPSWNPSTNFSDADTIIIAFRLLGDPEVDHWANKYACKLTAQPDDVAPSGQCCHAELMLQPQEGEWYRFSIMKKTGERLEDGSIKFKPGLVHGIRTSAPEMKKYTFYRLTVPRSQQYYGWQFLRAQLGAPFNMRAYVLNALPFLKFGAGKTEGWMLERQKPWFCSEVITSALHFMQIPEFMSLRPCDSSPNALYRIGSLANGLQPTCVVPIS